MGLFSTSSSPSTPKTSADGTPEAPDRTARAKCWEGRDAFFKCLDRNGIVDSIKDEDKASGLCGSEGKLFERDCASSWVVYFKKRRVMEHKRNETLEQLKKEGAQQIPGQLPGKGTPPARSS